MEERISKFLSGLLRHFPEKFGIKLDDDGWAKVEDVLKVLSSRYGVDEEFLRNIVERDEKKRFEIAEGKIRARYGHTVKVNVCWSEEEVIPTKLYHGTNPDRLKSILRTGILPMKRREVHLSRSVEDARKVGRRHSRNPVVLEIDAESMLKKGFEIRKKGKVYTADSIPPEFVTVVEKN